MPCPNRSLPTHASVLDPAHRTGTAHHQQKAAARPRLLLIGDDDAIAEGLARVLDHEGYAVERVVSLQDAITQFLPRGPDYFDAVLTIPCALGDAYACLEQLQARAELEAAHRGEHERAQLLIRTEEAWAQAEVAVQMRDDVLTGACHDLRTPLTSILGRTELLLGHLDRDKVLAPEFARSQLTALLQAAQRMRATVGEITEAAHLQMGQTLALDLAPVDVGEMVQTVVQDVIQGNAARDVSPVVVHVAANVLVHGDRPRLERVAQNIVENALKYSQDAAPVYVEVRQQDHWAVLTVRDHGVGVPADELAHIFTQFYRASTSKGTTGTGLGLAGSKTIVEQHGGQISLESTVGRGTVVTVWLPLCGR